MTKRSTILAYQYGQSLLTLLLTFITLTAITFLLARVIPTDPVVAMVGDRASIETYERVRKELHLDEPVLVQYVYYLKQITTGNFGTSLITSRPISEDMAHFFPATVELATIGLLIGCGIGVPLGVWAAVRQGTIIDQLIRIFCLIGHSVPVFWLGLLGLMLFYAKLGWVGGPGRVDIFYQDLIEQKTNMVLVDTALAGQWDIFRNAVGHLILPATLLGSFSLAYIARMTRSFMLNQLKQEYVVTARVKGLSELRIIWGHAFRNTLVPLITVIALTYAHLLEGAVLTETVFAWPGIGLYITNSLFAADVNAVLAGTIVIGVVFVSLNLLSDVLYRVADPRVS